MTSAGLINSLLIQLPLEHALKNKISHNRTWSNMACTLHHRNHGSSKSAYLKVSMSTLSIYTSLPLDSSVKAFLGSQNSHYLNVFLVSLVIKLLSPYAYSTYMYAPWQAHLCTYTMLYLKTQMHKTNVRVLEQSNIQILICKCSRTPNDPFHVTKLQTMHSLL